MVSAQPSREVREPFIEKLINDVGELRTMRLKDLEQLTASLLFLEDVERIHPILDLVREAMNKCDWSDVRSGRSFVYLTCHLARAQVYDISSIDSILEQANMCNMSDLETDAGLAEAIDFLFRLNIPLLSDVGSNAPSVIRFIQRNRFLCRNSLLQVLELDFIRDLYRLQTKHILRPEKKSCLIKYFHSEDLYSGVRLSFHQQTVNNIYRNVATLDRSSNHVCIDYALPCSTSKSIIVKRSKESPIAWDKERLDRLVDRTDYLVLCVPKKGELGVDGEVLGRCRTELRYLHTLGIPTRNRIAI